MPFLFRNTAHAEKIMDGPIGQELLDRSPPTPNAGLVALCWMDAGARSLYNTKRSIKSIEDVKGLKFRVIGNPIFIDMMNALGGNGVAMGYDQVFSALQTGVIDGAENNPPSYVFSNQLYRREIFLADRTSHHPRGAGVFEEVLDLAFGRRPEADPEFAARRSWKSASSGTSISNRRWTRQKAAGCQIVEITTKSRSRMAVKPVWDKYGPKYQT